MVSQQWFDDDQLINISKVPRCKITTTKNMADYLNFLGQCVRATEESVSTLEACITNLHPGVDDLPRLNKVLANEHVSPFPLYRSLQCY